MRPGPGLPAGHPSAPGRERGTRPARVKQTPGGRPSPAVEGSPAGTGSRGALSPPPAQAPLQDWGEETEDGAVYSVSLRRQRSQRLSPRGGPGDGPVSGHGGRAGRGGQVSRRAGWGSRAVPRGGAAGGQVGAELRGRGVWGSGRWTRGAEAGTRTASEAWLESREQPGAGRRAGPGGCVSRSLVPAAG